MLLSQNSIRKFEEGNTANEQKSQTLLPIDPIQTGHFITDFIVCTHQGVK